MDGIQSLYAVGGALCLFSSGIVSATARRNGHALWYFIGYLGLESLCFAFELLVAHAGTALKAWVSSTKPKSIAADRGTDSGPTMEDSMLAYCRFWPGTWSSNVSHL